MIRVILILCEGLTEKLYFDIVVQRRRIQKIRIEIIEKQGSHESLINRCVDKRKKLSSKLNLDENEIETWGVCDHDNYKKSFTKLKRYADKKNVKLAYSKYQFETYLIQHLKCCSTIKRGTELENELSDLLGFKYSKSNLNWLNEKVYNHPKIIESAIINSDNFKNHTKTPFLTVQNMTKRLLEFEL